MSFVTSMGEPPSLPPIDDPSLLDQRLESEPALNPDDDLPYRRPIDPEYRIPRPVAKPAYTIWNIIVAFLIFLLLVFIFQFSWNYSMTSIFGFRQIDFVQALLLLVVARFLLPVCRPETILLTTPNWL